MADVFGSYARPDEPHAKRVADALRAQGFSTWRDDELPAHRAYADVIKERLNASKAVVVIWSAAAAKSQWVRVEADAARQAGTLVQTTFDRTIPPCHSIKSSAGSIVRRADMDSDLDPIRDDPRFQDIYEAAKQRLAKLDLDAASVSSTIPAAAVAPLRS